MTDTIEREEYKGHKIVVWYDEFCTSPREWDNLGRMYCFDKRNSLGDEHDIDIDADEFVNQATGRPDLRKIMESVREGKSDIFLPIFVYEHSGITISTSRTYPYDNPWDSGVLGFYHVSVSHIRKEFGVKRISKRIFSKASAIAQSEIETYDDFLIGTGHGWTTYAPDGRTLDACGGYLGDVEHALCEARTNVDYYIRIECEAQRFVDTAFAL